MLHRRWWVPALICTACATTPQERISFGEAMRAPVQTVPRSDSGVHDAELHAQLFAFTDAAEARRATARKGSAMPAEAVQQWEQLLSGVDAFLARPVKQGTPFDAARARLVLQSELTQDGQTYGDVNASLAERVSGELEALSKRVAIAAQRSKVLPRRFLWPVMPVVVTSSFGTRVHPMSGSTQFHAGTDLLAEAAQPVFAAYDGVVVFSGWQGGYGKQIELQHDEHVSTRYGHLQTWLVDPGTHVKEGQVIGLAGSTGISTGVHVHFEVRRDGVPLDPEFELLPPNQAPRPPRLVAGR
ncbi:MAG: M23 family metallopeptidase [Myxococcaceae bacterium]